MNSLVTFRKAYKLLAIASILLAPHVSFGVPIVIQNAGFEHPFVDPAFGLTLNGTAIDYWTTPDTFGGGLWDINNFVYDSWTAPAPEGTQVLYVGSFGNGNYYEQTLSHIIQAGGTYKLTGFAGDPIGFQTSYAVELRAGDVVLASHTGQGIEGVFESFLVEFNSTGSPHVGLPLIVRLSSGGTQTAFDDLKLDGPAAPQITGDYDGNLVVDGADMLWWQRVYGLSVDIPGSGADGSANGVVDAADLSVWKNQYGATTPVVSVPEPATASILALAGCAFGLRRFASRNRTCAKGNEDE